MNPLYQKQIDDDILMTRVRAQLKRRISHSDSIQVIVTDGIVTLRGHARTDEVELILGSVQKISGVKDIINLLKVPLSQ